MTKNIKILGICIVVAITGLSIENALTGHGIKGNKNLNPSVLATGSNSGSGSCTSSWPGDCIATGNHIYQILLELIKEYRKNISRVGNLWCYDYVQECRIDCKIGGSTTCTPGGLWYLYGYGCSLSLIN